MYAKAKDFLLKKEVSENKVSENTSYSNNSKQVKPIDLKLESYQGSTKDPRIWGPAFWFTLHNSAAHYPEEASDIVKDRMRSRILALPYEIPCGNCRPHALNYIEKNRDNLDSVVSGRHNLGKFYVDFHNEVNKRHSKPLYNYEDVYKQYSGQGTLIYPKID